MPKRQCPGFFLRFNNNNNVLSRIAGKINIFYVCNASAVICSECKTEFTEIRFKYRDLCTQ